MTKTETLVFITGHIDPINIIDSAEAFDYWHNGKNYRLVFVIDNNFLCSKRIISARPKDLVFTTPTKNGWGRGVLVSILQAIEHFSKEIQFDNLLTMDDDNLTIGPFLEEIILRSKKTPDALFAGKILHVHHSHRAEYQRLRNSGFLANMTYNYRDNLVSGACMLWTTRALQIISDVGILPLSNFMGKIFPHFHLSHDHLSGYFSSCGLGNLVSSDPLGNVEWKNCLPSTFINNYGPIPIVNPYTAFIHPIRCNGYNQQDVRKYFRNLRRHNKFHKIKLFL